MAFRNPIIHLEFKQLRGYDVIVSYQWDCTTINQKIRLLPCSIRTIIFHNNIDSYLLQ